MRCTICVPIVMLLCVLGMLTGLAPAGAQDEPATTTKGKLIQAPAGAIAPDVVLVKGVVHMVYGLKNDAYYVKMTNDGKTFIPASPPVKLNGEQGVMTAVGERGPKLAVGKDRVIHVIWQDEAKPGAKTAIRYTRSLNNGRSFDKPPKTISEMPGLDSATLATDGEGHVVVFWHAEDERKPDVPAATWLYMARSDDSGNTFGKSEPVTITDHSGLASAQCQMRARMAIDNQNVLLAFRSAEKNKRDIYLLKGLITENKFSAICAYQSNVTTESCPMNGPEMNFDPTGRPFLAFTASSIAYWAYVDKEAKNGFSRIVSTPTPQRGEIYPTAVVNKKFEVLIVWQVGPASANGTATVKWAVFNMGGMFTGRQGTIGTTTSGTKATAFVGPDENFYIVTTAKK